MNRSKRESRIMRHPGTLIAEEMTARRWTQQELAKASGLSASFVSRLIRGERRIWWGSALGLSRAFGTSAQFWMDVQRSHDRNEE